jgi:ribose transport system substrate-binding protein
MKTILRVLIVMSLALLVVGNVFAGGAKEGKAAGASASGSQMVDTTKYKKAPPWTIGFSNASVSNTWRVSFVEQLRYSIDEAKKQGLIKNYYETNANDDPTKQVADVEDLITKGVDLLIVSASSSEALTPVVEKAMDKGIPVVTLDRNISSDKYVTFLEGNSKNMAKLQAEWLVEQIGGKGNVVLITGLAGASPAEDRLASATEVFKSKPGITILAREYGDWSVVKSRQIMETLIQKHPKIDAVWCDSMEAVGAMQAFQAANLPVPPITCEDANQFLKIWKNDPKLNARCVTFSVRQGSTGVEMALKILRGEPVPHLFLVPNTVITRENLDQYVRMDLPDSFYAETQPEVTKRLFPDK